MLGGAATITVVLLAFGYRLRGSGKLGHTGGVGAWGLLVAAACQLNGLDPLIGGVGAMLGMLIPHGEVYMVRTLRQTAAYFATGALRFAMLAPLFPAVITPAVLAGVVHVTTFYLGRKAFERGYVKDAVEVGEIMCGALGYGALLVLLAGGM